MSQIEHIMIIKTAYKDWITDHLQDLKALDDARARHLDYTPDYTFYDHSHRVAESMRTLALKMGKSKEMAEALYLATLIHDIGKTALPVEIWDYEQKDDNGNYLKPPEDLKKQRREHTTLGVALLRKAFGDLCDTDPFLRLACDLAQNHHEHLDGSGYLNKTAKDLSEEVQMLCICDAYDGWTIPRPHKTAKQLEPQFVLSTKMSDGRFNLSILKFFQEVVLCPSKPCL